MGIPQKCKNPTIKKLSNGKYCGYVTVKRWFRPNERYFIGMHGVTKNICFTYIPLPKFSFEAKVLFDTEEEVTNMFSKCLVELNKELDDLKIKKEMLYGKRK